MKIHDLKIEPKHMKKKIIVSNLGKSEKMIVNLKLEICCD